MKGYTVHYPLILAPDTEYEETVLLNIGVFRPESVFPGIGCVWKVWPWEDNGGYCMGIFLDGESWVETPGGRRYVYSDFPKLAMELENMKNKKILEAL